MPMSNNGEIQVYAFEPIAEGGTYLFEVREFFQWKDIERKVYFDDEAGLYIMYKGKRYYEYEFIYRNGGE
jgi:hypothetical protein